MISIPTFQSTNAIPDNSIGVFPYCPVEVRAQDSGRCGKDRVALLTEARELRGELDRLMPVARLHDGGKLFDFRFRVLHCSIIKDGTR